MFANGHSRSLDHLARAELQAFLDLRKFSHPCAVTLTMKKRSAGEVNDPIRASVNFRHFLNRLNGKLLGSKAKRHGGRIQTIVVLEKSADDRLHFHCVLDKPAHYTFDEFAAAIRTHWQRTKFGYQQVDVQDAATTGWTNYMLKLRQKDTLLNAIDWMNCHLTAE